METNKNQQQIDAEYIAWIPCLSGKLLFRYFSSGHPRATKTLLIRHEESFPTSNRLVRTVVISEFLNLKDDKRSGLDGNFQFVLTGSKFSDEDDFLGKIYVLPVEVAEKDNEWKNIYSLLLDIKRRADNKHHIDDYYKKVMGKLDAFSNPEFWVVSYKVDKCGFTYLTYLSVFDDQGNKPHVHKIIVTRQCFYYLKYSLHTHKHHHRNDDSLTSIHSVPALSEEVGLLLINDLTSSIVELNRNFGKSSSKARYVAQGIAAYALSLIESCFKKGFLSEHEYKHQRVYFHNILSSFNCSAEKMKEMAVRRAKAWSTARSLVLFAASILFPIMLLFRDDIIGGIRCVRGNIANDIASPFIWVFTSWDNLCTVILWALMFFSAYIARATELIPRLLASRPYDSFVYLIYRKPKMFRFLAWIMVFISIVIVFWSERNGFNY